MKKLLLIKLIVMSYVLTSYAQPTITFSTFESYTFADRFSTEYGRARVEDGFQWGGGLEIGLTDYTALEIVYQYLSTTVSYQGLQQVYRGKIGVNYFLVGGTRYQPLAEKVRVFGTVNAGLGVFNPSDELLSKSITKFTLGGRLGLCFDISKKISLKIHGQVLSPVQWVGGGFYVGSGGSGAGVSTGSTIYQFNVGGGINYRIN